jgi:hypothetical protein
MVSGMIYDKFKYDLMTKQVDLTVDVIRVALMTQAHSASTSADNTWAAVSANEIANGNGYTTNGAELIGKTVTQGPTTVWSAHNVQWTSSNITAWYAVVYNVTTGNLICSIDFGVPAGLGTTNGTFQITWNMHGILVLGG